MILLDILYNIIIYPIEFIIEIFFYIFYSVFDLGYAVSLILLSLSVSLLSLPLYNIAEKWQNSERDIQNKMKYDLDHIKKTFKGDEKFLLIQACYKIYNYKTIYAFRSVLGLIIQIPFFIASYHFIYNLQNVYGTSFLFISNLLLQDNLLKIGDLHINILPFIMTFINLSSSIIYTQKLNLKEKLKLCIIPLIFLVLLYNSSSGILLYWITSSLFSLVKNIVIKNNLLAKFNQIDFKKINLIKSYNIFIIFITFILLLLIVLGNIERKGYLSGFNLLSNEDNKYTYHMRISYYSKIFKNTDIYGVSINKNKIDNNYILDIDFESNGSPFGIVTLNDSIENIGKIELNYKLLIKNNILEIFSILLSIFIFTNLYIKIVHKFNIDSLNNIFAKNEFILFIISCLIVTVLSGIFITTSLISSSPQEFDDPFYFIAVNLSVNIGLFLLYPVIIYSLFSQKIKYYLTTIFVFLVSITLINTFIMKGNYININTDFIFDDTNLLRSSLIDNIVQFFLIAIFIFVLQLLLKFKKINTIFSTYCVLLIVLILISIFNIINIKKDIKKISKNANLYKQQYNDKIFNLSKNGENIFVFVLDRAIPSYWLDSFKRFPEYKEKLDGFTIFPNTVSFAPSTTAISPIFGGYDYLPYEISTNGNYNLREKHNESLLVLPLSLEKYDYISTMLDPPYANFNVFPDLSVFKDYTNIGVYNNDIIDKDSINEYLNSIEENETNTNILEQSKINEKLDKQNKFLKFSLFRMLPINLRYYFYRNGTWLILSEKYNINRSMYHYAMLLYTKNSINISENGNYYNMIHNMTTHEPNFFKSDYLPSMIAVQSDQKDLSIYKDEYSTKHFYANTASINIIIDFIEFLKINNVYDNTKIIIVSDHGNTINTTIFTNENIKFASAYNALLIYKDFNSRGHLNIDTNFMTIADVPYIATKHISNIKNIFNDKVITNDYKKHNDISIVEFNSGKIEDQYSNRYNFDIFYQVKDNIFYYDNWKKFKIDWNTKNVKKIDVFNN